MTEPKRDVDPEHLVSYVADRVLLICKRLRAKGFDPVLFEGLRSVQRQRWLYGQGRSKLQCLTAGISPAYAHPGNIVTWTLKSFHIQGKAADIISKTRGWNWPEFFDALAYEAGQVGMTVIPKERCHIQWTNGG
jgi:peptidoglycan LD-endopeptidase CwlK